MSLKDQINRALNIPEKDIGNWCSDLHIKQSKEVEEWLKTNYEYYNNVEKFVSGIDGEMWLDIPFAYIEYYNKG